MTSETAIGASRRRDLAGPSMARSGAGIGAGRTRILPGEWRSQAALRPRRPRRRSGQRRLDPPREEQLDDVDGDRRGILRRQLAAVGQHHERTVM
jgi:hypothetical protein